MSYKEIKLVAPKGYRFDKTIDGQDRTFWYLAKKEGAGMGGLSFNIDPEIKVKGVKK